jgi:osmoprotectant transport system substrate-binding protein
MLVAALVFVAAACGGGGGGGGDSSSGPSVSVGSKKFTEQILLGELYAQAFADEGYEVERKLNLGSEQVMDKSLQDGTIDVYPEYTGTAFVAILKKPSDSYPKSDEETYEQVAKFYKNRKDTPMQMLEPAPFNNSYGIVMLTNEANEMGIETLDDLAEKSDQLVFSSYSEFQNRSDGYPNMQKNYNNGFDFKDIKIVNDLGIRYKALAEGEADVGIGYTTDGQLASPKLKVIEDTKTIWPIYEPAPVVTQEFLDKNPDAKKILNEVSSSLNADKMRELNGAVDLEQEDYADVARQYLEDEGIIN